MVAVVLLVAVFGLLVLYGRLRRRRQVRVLRAGVQPLVGRTFPADGARFALFPSRKRWWWR